MIAQLKISGWVVICIILIASAVRAFKCPVRGGEMSLVALVEGMTKEDVRAILGEPWQVVPRVPASKSRYRNKPLGDTWIYKEIGVFGYVRVEWYADGG